MAGILSRLFSPSNTSLKDPEQWLTDWFLGGMSAASGVSVTPITILGVPTVFACVNRISGSLSSVPLNLYKRTGKKGGKEKAVKHPLFSLVHDAPNAEMSSVTFRLAMQANLSLRRSAYAIVSRDGTGTPRELWPVNPNLTVQLKRPAGGGPITYEIDGKTYSNDQVLALRSTTLDGYNVIDPLRYCRDSIGLAIALQDNAAKFFANSSRPGAILEHPNRLNPTTAKRIMKSFEAAYKGNSKAYRVAILEEGMKYVVMRHTNAESQMVEQRKFQDIAICQIYQVPPHKVSILDRATFSNIEFQGIEYVTDTILPQARIWEQELNRTLLTPEQRRSYFFEFNLDGLMRGDIKTRYDAYAIARNWGWLNVDEIRAMENMNPLPDGQGEVYLQPLNMQVAGEPKEPVPAPAPQLPDGTGPEVVEELNRIANALGKPTITVSQPVNGNRLHTPVHE